MIAATVLAVLMLLSCGSWWVWKEYYAKEQFMVAFQQGMESGDYSRADTIYA